MTCARDHLSNLQTALGGRPGVMTIHVKVEIQRYGCDLLVGRHSQSRSRACL